MATKQSVFAPSYEDILDDVEKKSKITQGAMSADAIAGSTVSTTLLGTDLMLGGGIIGGRWYTFFGAEGSGKSTHLMHMKMGAVDAKIPILQDNDYEGSAAPDYCAGIMQYACKSVKDVEAFYGLADNKGKWVKKPLIRYYNPSTAEDFFNPVASLLRKLPDKVYLEGNWFYAWDADKPGRAAAGAGYSKTMFTKYGRLFVEAENGLPQAIFYVDSYPAMFPSALDEDDAGRGMAAVARVMSENVPKVFPKLRPKNAVIIGVNQLRQRPGFTMGDPSYEPAGDTLKFASSVRVRQTPRAVPHASGQIEKEQSVLFPNTEDTYRYIHMKAIKNKISTPYLESWQRVWVDDGTGNAHGFCPVYDTFQYLKNTGQADGNMKKFKVVIDKLSLSLSWPQFKTLILKGPNLTKVLKELHLAKDPQIRGRCFHQLRAGTGFDLFFKQKKSEE